MRRLVVLLAAAAFVAGCGGDDSSSSTPAPTKEKSAPSESAPSASAGAPEKKAEATIEDFTFAPKSITVSAGGSVSWSNKDSANHNVAFDDKSVKGIGNLRKGEDGTVSFEKPGTYPYVCTYHPGMEGKVIVK